MATMFGNAIGGGVDRLVRWIVIPVTAVIPLLVRTGLLLAAFGLLWLAFLVALVTGGGPLDAVWRSLVALPPVVQAVAWLLFLPLGAGLWVWSATDWPVAVRLVLVLAVAGWNLLVFLPRRSPDAPSPVAEA